MCDCVRVRLRKKLNSEATAELHNFRGGLPWNGQPRLPNTNAPDADAVAAPKGREWRIGSALNPGGRGGRDKRSASEAG